MSERLSVALQENLLVLLCFKDKSSAVVRNSVEPKLFSSQVYRDIVTRVYEYIDQYKEPPRDHLPDLLEEELSSGAQAQTFIDVVTALHEQQNKVNETYTLNQLEAFVRQQTLKSSIISASEAIQEGNLDKAETLLQDGIKQRLTSFKPGITLADGVRAAYAKEVRVDIVSTGIKELDDHDLGPARGEFHLFMGPPKRGKSWWLVHMAKRGLIQKLKVVYLTLELSEAQIAQRLIQSLFSMTRRQSKVVVTRLLKDELGRFIKFDRDNLSRESIDDLSTRKKVEKRIDQLHCAENLIIKQFPSGALTVPKLKAYLDMLERSNSFVPDMLVIDYPDYMKIDPKNYRLEASTLYNDLRGVAVERNISIVVASKVNREGAESRLVTDTHAAEDYSRVYTADTVMTYTQTLAEKELGLARLFVSSSRVSDKDRFVVLLTQSYQIGQFALDSAPMSDTYWGQLEASKPGASEEVEDE